MEATGATQLNPAQLNILRLMSYIDTEQEQNELQDILLQFYRQKTDRLLQQFQKENTGKRSVQANTSCVSPTKSFLSTMRF